MENKTIRISVGGIIVAAIIMAIALFKVADNITDISFYQSPNPSSIAMRSSEPNMYLTQYEISTYLGISWGSFITEVKTGGYKGGYITETDYDGELRYIFPKADLDEWFAGAAAEHKHMTTDPSLLPPKRANNEIGVEVRE